MNSAHLIKLYVVYFLLTVFGLAAAAFALNRFWGVEIGGSLGIVTVILPAMLVGQRYAKRWNQRPPNRYAWRITGIFAALNLAAGIVTGLALIGYGAAWSRAQETYALLGPGYTLFLLGLLFAVYWATARFFFGFGAKNQMKSMAEQAARRSEGANQP